MYISSFINVLGLKCWDNLYTCREKTIILPCTYKYGLPAYILIFISILMNGKAAYSWYYLYHINSRRGKQNPCQVGIFVWDFSTTMTSRNYTLAPTVPITTHYDTTTIIIISTIFIRLSVHDTSTSWVMGWGKFIVKIFPIFRDMQFLDFFFQRSGGGGWGGSSCK